DDASQALPLKVVPSCKLARDVRIRGVLVHHARIELAGSTSFYHPAFLGVAVWTAQEQPGSRGSPHSRCSTPSAGRTPCRWRRAACQGRQAVRRWAMLMGWRRSTARRNSGERVPAPARSQVGRSVLTPPGIGPTLFVLREGGDFMAGRSALRWALVLAFALGV